MNLAYYTRVTGPSIGLQASITTTCLSLSAVTRCNLSWLVCSANNPESLVPQQITFTVSQSVAPFVGCLVTWMADDQIAVCFCTSTAYTCTIVVTSRSDMQAARCTLQAC